MRLLRSQGFLVLKKTIRGFGEDHCSDLAAALSFYTLFSVGPLLVMVIAVLSLIFDRDIVTGRIFDRLGLWIGADGAETVRRIVQVTYRPEASFWTAVISTGFLLYGSTGVFLQIQSSLDSILGVKPKPMKNFAKMMRDRFLSFGLVLAVGFLLAVSFAVSAILRIFGDTIQATMPHLSLAFLQGLNITASLAIHAALFTLIFKVLPDVHLSWRSALRGATLTAVLFAVGQVVIGLYLGSSRIASIYGAAASIVGFLIWVNYSSLILFFGAEFMKNDLVVHSGRIVPGDYAVVVRPAEV